MVIFIIIIIAVMLCLIPLAIKHNKVYKGFIKSLCIGTVLIERLNVQIYDPFYRGLRVCKIVDIHDEYVLIDYITTYSITVRTKSYKYDELYQQYEILNLENLEKYPKSVRDTYETLYTNIKNHNSAKNEI